MPRDIGSIPFWLVAAMIVGAFIGYPLLIQHFAEVIGVLSQLSETIMQLMETR